MVSFPAIAERASCELHGHRDLRLVALHGPSLQQVGCDNAISTGPYAPCGAWADAPDGIAFPSRHDPSQISVALFSRPGLTLVAAPSVPLGDQLPFVANVLAGYGKSVTDLPP
jgi:hypothetical protein